MQALTFNKLSGSSGDLDLWIVSMAFTKNFRVNLWKFNKYVLFANMVQLRVQYAIR